MKIPAIRQLPSGMWFCQLRLDGQSISITDEDYDVVYAKAIAHKAGIMSLRNRTGNVTVAMALDVYVKARENILSPSTIAGYKTIIRTRFARLQKMKISSLTTSIVQREINLESTLCSAKTLKNSYAFISSAIKEAGGDHFAVQLKQVPPASKKYLTPDQIPILLNAIRGHKYEIPILLGLWSLRRSEILALRWSDIALESKTIKVARGAVIDSNGQLVEKEMPKNRSSVRIIPICQQLYDALNSVENKEGRVFAGCPNSIYRAVNRVCIANGLPAVGAHGLRHSFASLAYSLGIPAKVAQAIGGWETDDVMMSIYTHISKNDIASQAKQLTEWFDSVSNPLAN